MHHRTSKKRGPVKNYRQGRVCKKHGCTQRLSMYNADEYCYVHRVEFMK